MTANTETPPEKGTDAKVAEIYEALGLFLDNQEKQTSILEDIKALLVKALQESGDGELAKVMGDIANRMAEVVQELKEVHGLQVKLPAEVSDRVTTGVETAILNADALASGDGVDAKR